jgi:hypothetical protein
MDPLRPTLATPPTVKKNLPLIPVSILLTAIILLGLYLGGVFSSPPEYPVLSDPRQKPRTDIPALFSQSGTVTAITSSQITIRYLVYPDYKVISFPLTSSTPIFKINKQTIDGKLILTEEAATISDITIGANVAVQIPKKTLESVAPTKVQIFPK